MIPFLRPKPKSPPYVFENMFLSRTPKLGVECLIVLALVMCADAFA